MQFTASQQKALSGILALFAFAALYHLASRWWYPPAEFDFTAFDEKFRARHDSIQRILRAGTAEAMDTLSRQGNEQVVKRPAANDTETSTTSAAAETRLVNINTASEAQLQTLPRVGPKTAARIIEYRRRFGPFATRRELTRVRGIGERTYQQIAPLIAVE